MSYQAQNRRRLMLLTIMVGLGLPILLLGKELSSINDATGIPAVISPFELKSLIAEKKAIQIIDARKSLFRLSSIPNSVRLDWEAFSETVNGRKWLLKDLNWIAKSLKKKGLSAEKPTIVYGDRESGWGEEGRILWMLKLVGYRKLSFLDGGIQGWQKSHRSEVTPTQLPKLNLAAKEKSPLSVRFSGAELKEKLSEVEILDVRSPSEYAGQTPHGSKKGGHIPGAKNLHIREFFDAKGMVLPKPELALKIKKAGISFDRPLVVYCTGGVRSALAHYLIQDYLGFEESSNYDGSWNEWAQME